jgi:serine protease Do
MKTKQFILTILIAAITSVSSIWAYNRYVATEQNNAIASAADPYHLADFSFPVAPSGMAPVDFTYAAALTTPAVVHVKTTYECRWYQ